MSRESEEPRRLDVHLALTRPLLLMGCEREPLLIAATIAGALIFVIGNAIFAMVGIGFWVVTVALLQRMAKADPQMSTIYVRHARYRNYYAGQSAHSAIYPFVRPQQ